MRIVESHSQYAIAGDGVSGGLLDMTFLIAQMIVTKHCHFMDCSHYSIKTDAHTLLGKNTKESRTGNSDYAKETFLMVQNYGDLL